MINPAHIDNQALERYYLSSPALGADDREYIALHIAECGDCSRTLEMIAAFYEDYASLLNESDAPDIPAVLIPVAAAGSDNAGGRVIALHPHRQAHLIHDSRPSILALAAQDESPADICRTAVTLQSSDSSVFLRLVRDAQDDALYLQIHADDPAVYSNVLVTFDQPIAPLLTNARGEARIDGVPGLQLHELHAVLRKPLDTITIDSEILAAMQGEITLSVLSAHGLHAEIRCFAGGEARLLLHAGGQTDNPFFAALEQGEKHQLVPFREDGSTALFTVPAGPCTIRMY